MANLLALASVALAGCISIPPFHGDGSGSGSLVPRLLATAYREGGTAGHGTPGMSYTGYSIATSGVHDGDLVLFVGSCDNGADNLWPLPGTGFTELAQHFFGTDTQTYFVAWKRADGEPDFYAGTYVQQGVSTSASAAIALIAIAGTDPTTPISASNVNDTVGVSSDPAVAHSDGVTTTVADSLVLFATGADWTVENGRNTYVPPSGYQPLASFGDRDSHWNWTDLEIAYRTQAAPGPSGALDATLVGTGDLNGMTEAGGAWGVALAIVPAR